MPRRPATSAVLLLAALTATACARSLGSPPPGHAGTTATTPAPSAAGPAAGRGGARQDIRAPIDASNFTTGVTNPYFPLHQGEQRIFDGVRDGKAAHEVFVVTSETKTILGVTCVVVRDSLTLDGKPAEQTDDWYAQDKTGNVWYFGEQTATLNPDGSVNSREGTFTAGVDGARAGIYITATPEPGADYLQESYPGHAEDHFVVTDLDVPVTVTAGSYPHALRTKEYTPLEPGKIDHKYYARGVGVVREQADDGSERLDLTSFTAHAG
jgi:hypothetical protein